MEKKTSVGGPIFCLIGLTAVATLLTIGLALFGHETAAAIVGVATFFLWLSIVVVTTAVVVSWWSALLMERGAQIALIAQTSDDKRDVAMINSISKLANWWKEAQPNRPALPLPSQEAEKWLPEVTAFDVVDTEANDGA